MCVCVCVRACVRVCVRVCARARACRPLALGPPVTMHGRERERQDRRQGRGDGPGRAGPSRARRPGPSRARTAGRDGLAGRARVHRGQGRGEAAEEVNEGPPARVERGSRAPPRPYGALELLCIILYVFYHLLYYLISWSPPQAWPAAPGPAHIACNVRRPPPPARIAVCVRACVRARARARARACARARRPLAHSTMHPRRCTGERE